MDSVFLMMASLTIPPKDLSKQALLSSVLLIIAFNMKIFALSDSTAKYFLPCLVVLPSFFRQIKVKYFYIAAYSKMSPGQYQYPTFIIRYSRRKVLKLINLGNNSYDSSLWKFTCTLT